MAISLASISRTRRASRPPRVVIHGQHGVGKTTLGASAYAPIFLPTEEGLEGLEVDAFPKLTSYADALAAVRSLAAGGHEYGTAVLDSLDWLEPLIWQHVCDKNGWKTIEDPGFGKGYIDATATWSEFLEALDTVRDAGMAVICIAHSEVKRFDAPDTEAYDRYQIKLQRAASAIVHEWADIVGFAQVETIVTKDKPGAFSKDGRTRGVSTGRHLLRVVEKPAYVAKNRYGLPDTIPLDWNALVAALTPPPAAVQTQVQSEPQQNTAAPAAGEEPAAEQAAA
jgi:hypothetical protein